MASQQQASAGSPPSAQVVGNAFVHQYYHILYQSPELVYRFYQESSKLGRPEAKGVMSSITTVQAINEKILSMDYDGLRAEIKTVDAQESLYGGVLVLVIGYVTGNDDVRKNFTQSFFLATQDKGYFVLNDIFRYVEEDKHQQGNQALANGTGVSDPETHPQPEEQVQDQSESPPAVEVIEENNPSEYEEGSDVEADAPGSQVVDEVPNNREETPAESGSPATHDDAPKKSYASIVKVMKENIAPSSVPPPAPVPPATEFPATSSNIPETSSVQESEADSHSIYIKSLPLNATPAQLEEEFKRFGPIKPGGIQVRSHKQQGFCFGFVEFEAASSVQSAIEASPVMIGGRQAFVEEKRPAGPREGASFQVHQLKEEHVRKYRQNEKQKMNETLSKYLDLCSNSGIQAENVVIEMDDIGKGLVELITQHGITNLVMDAAEDRQYSRDKVLDGQGMTGSPMVSLETSEPRQLTSASLPHHQTETLERLSYSNRRTRSESYDLPGRLALIPVSIRGEEGSVSSSEREEILHFAEGSVTDTWEEIYNDEESMTISPVQDLEVCPQYPTAGIEQEDTVRDDEVYQKLESALTEAEDSKREAYEESLRRRKAERDALRAARRAKTLENLYTMEIKQRKELEEILTREKLEAEKLKLQHDELKEEVLKANENKLQMELQIDESENAIKNLQEKLSATECLLSSVQSEYEEEQKGRENAIREVEELRRKREEEATSSRQEMNFSKFTYSELERATNNFDDSLKVGKGGYGSVYKGFLRHTMVAIKLLDPESMQGQTEFYQEVKILSQVRHPHLITLIGACPESWALIYEYLPQGSLTDNLAQLAWPVRIRISAEICSALIFLHSYTPHVVVHGDLNPANILLDSNFTSKLGDFGICRLLVQSNTTTTLYRWTNPKGTFAYIDPEFLSTGELTPQSDVYSFGVILLQLLTGKQALGIIKEVKEAMEDDRLHEILDASAGEWPFLQAKQLANLALRCCQIKRKKRPDLAQDAWRVLEPMRRTSKCMGSPSSSIPPYFICPIFQEIMMDPHIAADGFTYEAEALKGWLDSGHDTSPMTNLKLSHCDLIPNHALRSAIQGWLHSHK